MHGIENTHQVLATPPFRNVQLEQPVVSVEDVKLPVAPLDAQRTTALLLVLQRELLRPCLAGKKTKSEMSVLLRRTYSSVRGDWFTGRDVF